MWGYLYGGVGFRATGAVHGSSQARGWMGAVATGLHHSARQRRILNPLSEARDPTLVSRILVGFVTAEPRQELPGVVEDRAPRVVLGAHGF